MLEKSKHPRSYLLENQLGNQIRRNRRHLIPTNDEMKYEDESVDDRVVNNPAAGSDCQQVERLVDNGMVNVPSEGQTPDVSGQHRNVTVTTRSGHVIRKPSKYNDYKCV